MRNKLFTFVTAFAASAGLCSIQAQQAGDVVIVNGESWELGENIITNGSFENDVEGWTTGSGVALGSSEFTVYTSGGVDNGAYLVATTNTGKTGAGSIGTAWPIEAGEKYYFTFSIKSMGGATGDPYNVIALDSKAVDTEPLKLWGTSGGNGTTPLYGDAVVTADGEWTQNEVIFTNTDNYPYLCCNFRWMSNQWGLDNFYLCKITPANPDDGITVLLNRLDKVRESIDTYLLSAEMQEYIGLATELNAEYEQTYDRISDNPTIEEVQAEIDYLQTLVDKAKAGITLRNELNALAIQCTELQNAGYPGTDAFVEAVGKAQETLDNLEESKYADYENGIAELTAARLAYYYSQVPTEDNPADYSFLIQGPSFYNPDCGLTYEEMNGDNRTTWQYITPWVNGSIRNGGDFRSNYIGNKPCWNSWSTDYTSMDIHQDLTNLPNGVYTVECYAITQDGCINDQHAYASGLSGIAVSDVMTIDGGWNTPEGWEKLTTAQITVVDGKLTIGFASTKDPSKVTGSASDGRNGWFCVTDFKLNYYGPAATDLKTLLNARVNAANELTSSLKGDRKALEGALAIAAAATTDDQILAAMDTINAGISIVETSNAAYTKFVNGGLATAKAYADTVSLTNSKEIIESIVARTEAYLASDAATSATMNDTYAAALTNYVTYGNALFAADAIINNVPAEAIASTVTDLEAILADQKATLNNNIAGKATIDWFITYMNSGIMAIKSGKYIQEAKAAGSNYDISGMIMNPDAAAETGWIINKGKGNTNTGSGQHYSGDATKRYFDSWNGTSGVLNYTAYQEINFLPNGTYSLKFAGRSTCKNEGVKVFATTTEADTIWCTVQPGTWLNPETNEVEDAWDSRGSIWEAAVANEPEGEVALANEGKGRGWNEFEITNIQVTDHKLAIGMSTDSLITHVPFTGTWFSVVDFQLTMNTWAADNGNDYSWVTGMDIPITDDLVPMVIKTDNKVISVTNAVTGEKVNNYKVYTVTGSEVNPTAPQNTGIYVVKAGAQVQKVAVK